MKYFQKYILVGFYLCLLVSCAHDKNSEKIELLKKIITDNLGEKLILPDSIQIYKLHTTNIVDSTSIFDSPYKIYSHINVSCGACVMNIDQWSDLIPEFQQYKVPIILICKSDDNFELIKHLDISEQIQKFPYPLFFDKKDNFIKKNSFMHDVHEFRTVLTDRSDNILVMGNPLASKMTKKLYLDFIKNNRLPNNQ